MPGQFSAYINVHTGVVTISKAPFDFEYEENKNFSALTRNKPKRELMEEIEQYFSINYIPDEQQVVIQ